MRPTARIRLSLLHVATSVGLLACSPAGDAGGPAGTATWATPPVQARWAYAIGAANTDRLNGGATPDGTVVSLDLLDVEAATVARLRRAGRYVICYYSAGTSEAYRTDPHSVRLLDPALNLGEVQRDGGVWAGERWLDLRGFAAGSSARVRIIREVMAARLDQARAAGCAAVEPDNVDAWANDVSRGAPAGTPPDAIPEDDQLAYNRWTAREAHARGLAALLKNDLDHAAILEPEYDGALNEECLTFEECALLTPFRDAGKAIYVVEYRPAAFITPARRATASALHLNVILTDLDVNALNPLASFGSW